MFKKSKVEFNNRELFEQPYEIDRAKLELAVKRATDKLKARVQRDGTDFPTTCSKDMKYVLKSNYHWECGMYTGCFWHAYLLTGDPFFKEVAESHLPSYQKRLDEKIGMDDHDVGFVFTPSCVAAYRLTGNEDARRMALEAAEYFYKYSYSKEGKFIIRYHKGWDSGDGCRTMMDSLMNAPLLFWAAKETGNEDYFKAALEHTRTTAELLIREDGSSFHHYQFDPKTAGPVRGLTWQGRSDDSCWSRGHSWGVYGFPTAYNYAKEEFQKETHRAVTYFALNHMPKDLVPYWDFDFTEGDEPRDSSVGAICACGMLQMAKQLPDTDPDKQLYKNAANRLLEAVIDNCTGDIGVEYDGLINRVTHALPQGQGIDECAIYGDYFYLEALARLLLPNEDFCW